MAQENKYGLLSRIMDIQKERASTLVENNIYSRKQKAIKETKVLTVHNETPESMYTKCSVMKSSKKPLPGWSQEEADACIPFLQRWNECMKIKADTIFIKELNKEVPVKTIQSLNTQFLLYLSKFYTKVWDVVIVLIGTGSFPDQIMLTHPDLSHELQGDKILILNCDKDHSEFKEGEFNLYETLDAEDPDFLNEMANRFDAEFCESEPTTFFGTRIWDLKCYASEEQYVEYVVAKTEWEDKLSPYFLPDAKRTILVDMTNRPAAYIPKQLAEIYDAIYVKTNEPVDPETLGTALE